MSTLQPPRGPAKDRQGSWAKPKGSVRVPDASEGLSNFGLMFLNCWSCFSSGNDPENGPNSLQKNVQTLKQLLLLMLVMSSDAVGFGN